MAIDNTKKSGRLLQSRRYTHETFTDAQEAFTSTLDINATEIYIDQNLIPTSSLPFSGSGQHLSTFSGSLKYYYRQALTKSDLNNEVWFFVVPSGSASGIGAQLITGSQQTNFISPKYAVSALANANSEDTPPGYLAKVFVSANATTPANGDVISINNYAFDYKTGVLQFSSSAVTPTAGQYVYMSAYQYIGRTLNSITTATGVSTASFATTASYILPSGLPTGTVSSSAQINTGSFTGSFVGSLTGTGSWATSASYVLPSGLPTGTVSSSTQINTGSFSGSLTGTLIGTGSWASNAISASFATTASYVIPSGLPTGTVSSSQQINTGSFTGSFIGIHSGSTFGTASWATSASYVLPTGLPAGTVSSSTQINTGSFSGSFVGSLTGTGSWATSASYALPSGLPIGTVSSSAQINTGSFSGSLTGILIGTASWANNAISSSFATTASAATSITFTVNTGSFTGSFIGIHSGSTFGTASWASNAISSSFATTASYAPVPIGTVSSSQQINTGSFTGSFIGIHSGSLFGTSSWASNAISASYAPVPVGTVSSSTQINTGSFSGSFTGTFIGTSSWASNAISSSFATTASYAPIFPYIGAAVISGSLNITGSGITVIGGNITASAFSGDGSQLTNLPSSSVVIDSYTFTGNGGTSNYTLGKVYDISSLTVTVGGLTQTSVTDYTLATTTLSFLTAPPSQSNILVRALVNAAVGAVGSFTGSFLGSASFATTASYVASAPQGDIFNPFLLAGM